jgi:hypothetical protein
MGWVLGLLAVAVAWLCWQSIGSAAARARARAGYLDACAPLFSGVIKGVAETGFARLSGQYRGQTFDVQVVPDSLSVRKLPVLWLLVTLPEKLPVRGTFDVMMRATGLETFSGFARLEDQIAAPAGFPADCSIRTDAPDDLPDSAVIGRYLAGLDKARLKEVVVAPTGVRVVWLAEEADRGGYLLFRDAEMGRVALQPAVLQPLMDGLCDLWAGVLADAAPMKRVLG